MKVTKVIVVDNEGNEQTLNIVDGVIVALTEDSKILTQTTDNDTLNLKAVRSILGKLQ